MNNKDALMVELYKQSAENRNYGVSVTTLADATGMINTTAHSTLTALVTMGWVETDILNDVISGKPKKSAWLTPDGWEKAKQLAGAEDVAKIASERAESSNDQVNNASENSELTDVDDTNVADSQAIQEGYKRWTGGVRPVELLDRVYVVFRNGTESGPHPAVSYNWHHLNVGTDIMAYRLSEPATDNVYPAENSDQLDEKLDIPAPDYNPDDVAFKTAAVRIAELEAEIIRLNNEDNRNLTRFIGFHRPFDEAGIAMDKPLEERIKYLIDLIKSPTENASLIDQRGEQYRAVIDDYELAQSYLEEYAVMENDDTVADRVAWLISEHKRFQAKVGNLFTQVANLERTVKFGSTSKPEAPEPTQEKSIWVAEQFLHKSLNTIEERAKEYDQEGGERSMGKTVQAFNIITGHDLKESDGWLLMELLKNVRQWSTPNYHHDSALDGVAYSALKAEALAGGK